MTDVTIRGINDEVYSSFSAEARRRGVPIGELVTIVMRAFLDESTNDPLERISFLSSMCVSQDDLEQLNGRVYFSDIGRLEFKNDVKWETFSDHVSGIEEIGRLSYPKAFPKLAMLARCRNVGRTTQT